MGTLLGVHRGYTQLPLESRPCRRSPSQLSRRVRCGGCGLGRLWIAGNAGGKRWDFFHMTWPIAKLETFLGFIDLAGKFKVQTFIFLGVHWLSEDQVNKETGMNGMGWDLKLAFPSVLLANEKMMICGPPPTKNAGNPGSSFFESELEFLNVLSQYARSFFFSCCCIYLECVWQNKRKRKLRIRDDFVEFSW